MAEYNKNEQRELGWDDVIENDSPEFVIVPDGDYNFEVKSFERDRYPGSDREGGLPPCNMAVLNISIENDKGVCNIQHRLFLHTRCEGLLCEFFAAIGQKKHGEKLKMDWNKVVGSRGRAKVGHREYNGETYNEIKRFYKRPESAPKKSFTPGRF